MPKMFHVRRFPEVGPRVESGPIMFGDDWPGIFLRGDDAHVYAVGLRELLLDRPDVGLITKRVLEGLLDALESCNCENNDGFPAWHQDDKQDGDGT
jgi:hypothetical protein